MVRQSACHLMHRGVFGVSIVFLILGLLVVPVQAAVNKVRNGHPIMSPSHYRTITPQVSNDVDLSPGKGWVLYGLPSNQTANTMAYATVGYMRYDWSTIEPVEGRYNWSLIDSAINAWKTYGKRFAFGVMNANSSDHNIQYVTPQWVFADGASYVKSMAFDDPNGKTSLQYIPVWDDPIFLQKVKDFLTALAQRYDNNPNIAFIDVRSYGNWGEQHVYGIPPSVALPSAGVQRHIQMYKDAFKHVQIIAPWGMSNYNGVYNWAVNNGVGLRRDGILGNSDGSETGPANSKAPAVFEFYGSYQSLVKSGNWSDAKLLSAVNNGKPSYIGMGQWGNDAEVMLAHEQPLVRNLANQMGYHFVLTNATIPTVVNNNQATNFSFSWSNQGVTYLYGSCKVAVALLDSSNNVVQQQWFTGSNPNAWAPGQTTQENASITFTGVRAGNYKLAVGLFQNTSDPNPVYMMGNQGRTSNGWYVLSSNVTMPANVLQA